MRTLLLDRDGVINHDARSFIRSPADWHAVDGSLEAIARAQHAGYRIVVVSNQSGLGRGLLTMRDLNAIHGQLQHELGRHGGRVDAFFFCPHRPEQGCDCRKPAPGLLQALAARLGIQLTGVPFIGDRSSDAEAALAAGAKPLLVRTGLDAPQTDALPAGVPLYDNLAAAVETLL